MLSATSNHHHPPAPLAHGGNTQLGGVAFTVVQLVTLPITWQPAQRNERAMKRREKNGKRNKREPKETVGGDNCRPGMTQQVSLHSSLEPLGATERTCSLSQQSKNKQCLDWMLPSGAWRATRRPVRSKTVTPSWKRARSKTRSTIHVNQQTNEGGARLPWNCSPSRTAPSLR